MLRISHEALTFDDVLLVPGYSDVTAKDVSTNSQLTRDIVMNIPLVSAAMDTVTEARLAIAIAAEGGVGIIHKSMTIEQQAREVHAVKKYESGVVKDPHTIESTATLKDLHDLTVSANISGLPVLEDGNLIGIVTRRDPLCHRYGCAGHLGDDAEKRSGNSQRGRRPRCSARPAA